MNPSPPPTVENHADAEHSPGRAPVARRRRKEARPSELITAALELFVEKGYAATRLEDVAFRAGVSKGTLYLYFDSKESLFKAVIEQGMVATLSAAEQQVAEYRGSACELLRQLLFGWWQQIGETRHAGLPKLMVAEASNFPAIAQYYHDAVILRGRALVRGIIARGIEQGEFRVLDLEAAVDVTIAPLLMLVIWRHSFCHCGHPIDPENYLTTHLELLLRGLTCPQEK